MNAYLLSDGEFQTPRAEQLQELIKSALIERGCSVSQKAIQRDELQFCRGCFDCWVKTPGECAMKDGIAEINRACMTSDVVVYLCPVVFGQFSANMKSAIDRWLPNMMPFFTTRKDGSTIHPPRYKSYPNQVMLAYAEHLSESDAQLFLDITKKHRNNVTILIDRGNDAELSSALRAVSLDRVGGSL
jgi:multimeric flavodoxin WrbA